MISKPDAQWLKAWGCKHRNNGPNDMGQENSHLNIQIFGIKKCFDTQKAERYFKERNIKFQYIDLKQKGLSKGEFESVKKAVGLNDLINRNAKEYKQLNLDRIGGAGMREEILFSHPGLFNTPIVRNGRQATVGYQPEVWKDWE